MCEVRGEVMTRRAVMAEKKQKNVCGDEVDELWELGRLESGLWGFHEWDTWH